MVSDAITYKIIPNDQITICRELCDELMAYQASVARFGQDKLATMTFENRMVPAVEAARDNHVLVAFDGDRPVAYAYSSVCAKESLTLNGQPLVDPASVASPVFGVFNNFFILKRYRSLGIGSILFARTMDWLWRMPGVDDAFVFVSNGNDTAQAFYQRKGFSVSHPVMEGFITALRQKRPNPN